MSTPITDRYKFNTIVAAETDPSVVYTFRIEATDELEVYLIRGNTNPVLQTGYTVTDIGNVNGGSVNLIGDFLAADIVLCVLVTPEDQQRTWDYQDEFDRTKIEGAIDYLSNGIKRCLNLLDRCIKYPYNDMTKDLDLEPAGVSGLKALLSDADGLPYWGDAASPPGVIGNVIEHAGATNALSETVTDITLTEDTEAMVKALVFVEGRGMFHQADFFLENEGGTLTITTGVQDDYKSNADDAAETCPPEMVVTSGVFRLRIDTSNLTAARNVKTRFLIYPSENGTASFT